MLRENADNSLKDKKNLKDSLSDISHQLKTPLTSISIMLDNIIDDPNMDDSVRNDFIMDIKREIINLLKTFFISLEEIPTPLSFIESSVKTSLSLVFIITS